MYARFAVVFSLLVLSACGGGGGDNSGGSGGGGSGGSGGGTGNSTWVKGVYQPSSNFAGHCAAPRAGTKDVTGTITDENNWLRSWTNELYLWYDEVPDLNPALYSDTETYFDLLKTSAKTPTNKDKDQFHFTYTTTDWEKLSQGGQSVGYGIEWAFIANQPPRRAVVAFVQSNTQAALPPASLTRGVEILTVDGVDLVNDGTKAGVDKLNAGLAPANAGETHTFGIRRLDGSTGTVSLTATTITSDPVPVVKMVTSPTGVKVGYILFNDHVATSESGLLNAVNTLKGLAIQDLVLDIRYNGGGYLDIAAELAYMIGGSNTTGQTFEKVQFNSKYPNTNPIEGGAITPTGFWTTARGLQGGLTKGTAFPTLNLSRVFVLTGNGTCSASEAIINGLRGVGVEVIQIGATTCGKPYGFYPQDNCGTTYFSIEFKGVNAKGFGDYADGFSPKIPQSLPSDLPGCSVADDFTHDLGDTAENRLESALVYRDQGVCVALSTLPQADGAKPLSAVEGVVPKSIWHTNRILRQQ